MKKKIQSGGKVSEEKKMIEKDDGRNKITHSCDEYILLKFKLKA